MISNINLEEKFKLIYEYWTPKIVGELNGQFVKLAKLKGEFVWHNHEGEDELFWVYKGTLIVDFEDKTIYTTEGNILIIPQGINHRPRTDEKEVWVVLFEPKNTKHTGDIQHKLTVNKLSWI
jgi:mannose-6-phosphate isomerase-like protein (cupin superfamily)